MDVVGSEIGQKMRSAIKAKLTELGCYVDDELPDYVMVMVANKRTREQMEDDLQLFLTDNTELFVNWLHQVLKKLQEVTVTTPMKAVEADKSTVRSHSKERKSKEKKLKDKIKKSDLKKAKKKDKEKSHRKKEEKKSHKSKKKSKDHEMIRPKIPPLLMNMEKESEPSITDVFAGQILKNHGITLDEPKDELKVTDKKPVIAELKRPIVPIIDPASIPSQPEIQIIEVPVNDDNDTITVETNKTSLSTLSLPGEEQLNQIEARIQGLKQKLAEQLDSMSEDEDFLNIRTEADELMTDFAEDVFQEISQPPPVSTTPIEPRKSPTPPEEIPKSIEPEIPKEPPKELIETLPHIELKLPKRPIRERLGIREELKKIQEVKEKRSSEKRIESPERFTPEREPEMKSHSKSAKSRLGDLHEPKKRISISEDTVADKSDTSKRLTSKVSVLENRPARNTCASIVRVRPRPRVGAPASSLLLRAVADAHKSLLNIPPKIDSDPHKVKRALVLPMRRSVETQKIVIQVPGGDSAQDAGDSISLEIDSEDDKSSKVPSDADKDEYTPGSITKKIINTDYVPSWWNENRSSSLRDDTLIIETKNIHNLTADKNTQFIVTMDGYHPNAFLAKKLQTEGLLNDEDEIAKPMQKTTVGTNDTSPEKPVIETKESPTKLPKEATSGLKKRLSNTSEESDTQVIIKQDNEKDAEKRKTTKVEELKEDAPVAKKRRGSPIVFDVEKKVVERERQRTESASSDNQVTVVTTTNTHKYDAVPPLSGAERKSVWCRAFPMCRYGASCAFAHPRCKFAAACTRRNCVYSHALLIPNALPTVPAIPEIPVIPARAPLLPAIASHVVPAANYKSISSVGIPNMCKYYPSCVNPACHFYHPKPCRYGKNCVNKLECNFYHADMPAKW